MNRKKEFDFYFSCLGVAAGIVTVVYNFWPINLLTILGIFLIVLSVRLFCMTQINRPEASLGAIGNPYDLDQKQHMPEAFGSTGKPEELGGATSNPHDLDHTDRGND